VSLAVGAAASYGILVGMVRAADTEQWNFEAPARGVQDYAVLAGVRSRGERLFMVGAVGLAQATPVEDIGVFGAPNPRRLALAFDLSAHADYTVGGLSLALAGTLGPPKVNCLAVSLGAELGWFGWKRDTKTGRVP
jgi:hypothetical protein